MIAYVETNVLIRYITGEPAAQARRASAFLREAERLQLADLIVAEAAYVLESFYRFSRAEVAESLQSIILSEAIVVSDAELLLRSLELYESYRLDFADGYVAALAERGENGTVVSFDRDFDRVSTITRTEPV
jgi:predicted nucleic acid-binding protein